MIPYELFAALLVFAGYMASMIGIDLYVFHTNRWHRTLPRAAGNATFLFFMGATLFLVVYSLGSNVRLLPAHILDPLVFLGLFAAPWFIGLWFLQLALIRERHIANSHISPPSTLPVKRARP